MATISEKIVINAPVEKVFGFVTNPDNWTEYVTSLTEVSNVSSPGLEPGTSFDWEYRMLGIKLHGNGRISDNVKGHEFGLTMDGSIPIKEHYTFAANGGSTELAIRIDYEMPSLVLQKIANSSLVEKLNRREALNVLEKVKLLCEEM
ncbi:MAG: SRPBCC family protein [Geobacter sp.]|nr:SRPBCC family protein [Geobacter sp.]